MNTQELKVNYKKLLNKAAQANGRKETVSYLNRAAKIKSKICSNTKVYCFRCNGAGFLRISSAILNADRFPIPDNCEILYTKFSRSLDGNSIKLI